MIFHKKLKIKTILYNNYKYSKSYTKMASIEDKFPEACVIDGVGSTTDEINVALDKSLVEGNQITILKLPPKGSANDMNVKQWDQVILTQEWQKKARDAQIPYETEWFVITHIEMDEDGNPIWFRMTGSMCGGWDKISWNTPNIIASIFGNMMG